MAQLLALLILLVFVVLTRGSPSVPFLALANPRTYSVSSPLSGRTVRTPYPRYPNDVNGDGLPTPFPKYRDHTGMRERRSQGPDRRRLNANGSNVSRAASLKYPLRHGTSSRRQPVGPNPIRSNSDNGLPDSAISLNAPPFHPLRKMGSPAPSTSLHTSKNTSSTTALDVFLDSSKQSPSASTVTSETTQTRWAAVDSIKRKLKQLQPRRSSSVDAILQPRSVSPVQPKTASAVLDRRRMFLLGSAGKTRKEQALMTKNRRGTDASADDEGGSRAWLSTSEDSGDDETLQEGGRRSPSDSLRTFLPSPENSESEGGTTKAPDQS